MSTRTANLRIEQSYLAKAWLVVAAIVIAAAAVITLGVLKTSDAATTPGLPRVTQVQDYGPTRPAPDPIVINGVTCQQCR